MDWTLERRLFVGVFLENWEGGEGDGGLRIVEAHFHPFVGSFFLELARQAGWFAGTGFLVVDGRVRFGVG